MNKLVSILSIIIVVLVGVIALFLFVPDKDVTSQTEVFIQNNSSEQPSVTVEYKSSVCPESCTLELGRFAVNEGRGISFANPTQGSFTVKAAFISGTQLISEEQLATPEEYTATISADVVQIKK